MKNNNQTLNNLMEDINVPIPEAPWIAKSINTTKCTFIHIIICWQIKKDKNKVTRIFTRTYLQNDWSPLVFSFYTFVRLERAAKMVE